MSSLAIILVLCSAILHALKAYLVKVSHHKVAYAWLYVFVGLIALTPLGVWTYLKNPPDFEGIWLIIIFTSIFHGLYTLIRSLLYENSDLSFAYPITQSAPILITLWYLITGNEILNIYGIIGIATMTLGAYLVQSTEYKLSDFFKLFQSRNRNLLLALATTITIAAYSITDATIINQIDPLILAYYLGIPILLFLTPELLRKGELKLLKIEWNRNKASILFIGITAPLGYLLILWAFQLSQVSYISSLRQVSVIIGVIMGQQILKELHHKKRLYGSILILTGIFLISILG